MTRLYLKEYNSGVMTWLMLLSIDSLLAPDKKPWSAVGFRLYSETTSILNHRELLWCDRLAT